LESQIDLAIRISNNPDPGLISRRLGSCKSVLLASPSYLDSTGRPQSPEALTQHQCLSHSTTGKQLWQFNRGQELVKVEIDSNLTCNDASVLLHAALAGAGLTIQPTYLVQDYINSGKLEVVLPQWQVPELAIQALYPSRKHLPLPLRAFLDFLATHFATPRW
jgi:DNA-binding transcriptional LysR family regulator